MDSCGKGFRGTDDYVQYAKKKSSTQSPALKLSSVFCDRKIANTKIWRKNGITTLIQSGTNHSCGLTPGLLIAMQLQVQLGNLADKCGTMNYNQLFKDFWFWMVGEQH